MVTPSTPSLPPEVVQLIYQYLPEATDLKSAGTVCKGWNSTMYSALGERLPFKQLKTLPTELILKIVKVMAVSPKKTNIIRFKFKELKNVEEKLKFLNVLGNSEERRALIKEDLGKLKSVLASSYLTNAIELLQKMKAEDRKKIVKEFCDEIQAIQPEVAHELLAKVGE